MAYRPKLFTGISLDAKTRAACAEIADRLQCSGMRGRLEQPEKLHITLAFLGWVNPQEVEAIERGLHESAACAAPFSITLDSIGAFPHERNPHIVWIGSREVNPGFAGLSAHVRSVYEALGFTFRKAFVPHVTIARIKEHKTHLPIIDVTPMPMKVSRITLFESLPAGRTTRYEVRTEAKLAG